MTAYLIIYMSIKTVQICDRCDKYNMNYRLYVGIQSANVKINLFLKAYTLRKYQHVGLRGISMCETLIIKYIELFIIV